MFTTIFIKVVVPGTAASASRRHLLEMQNLWHPISIDSEILEVCHSNLGEWGTLQVILIHLKLRTKDLHLTLTSFVLTFT